MSWPAESMDDPTVSVLTVCLDRPALLRTRAIPSVLDQTYTRWELIVVGHPSDRGAVREVVDAFDDDRIRYVELDGGDRSSPPSPGSLPTVVAAALDHGAAHAGGELIALLSDADRFLPHHLGGCVDVLGRTGADLVCGPVIVREPGTGSERTQPAPRTDPAAGARPTGGADVIVTSSVCFRADASSRADPSVGDGAEAAGGWRGMVRAGARLAILEDPQAVVWDPAAPIHISLPSLPPIDTFAPDVARIVSSRWTSNSGPYCDRLEAEARAYLDVEHVVAAPSGDVALGMAFQAVRTLLPGRDEVIVPSYTFPSTANAVIRAGLRPRFCDVDPSSLCATAESVRPLLSSRTAAIVPVHAHGNPCDMPSFESLAAESGAMLISDAAAAFGATLDGRRIGGFGDLEVFSLSSTKVMTAGEGGLLACRDGDLASLLRRIGRYGLQSDYESDVVGINGRLAELPAALAVRGLPLLDGWLRDRRRAGELYTELLAECPGVRLQQLAAPSAVPTWKDVPLIVDDPAAVARLADRLARYGVQTRPYYRPLHRMGAFRSFAGDDVPISDGLEGRVLCVPIYNDIRPEAVTLVAEVVRETRAGVPLPASAGTSPAQ
jgi:dTDP-4-amino-4,6-dideoxygalactose transaminase